MNILQLGGLRKVKGLILSGNEINNIIGESMYNDLEYYHIDNNQEGSGIQDYSITALKTLAHTIAIVFTGEDESISVLSTIIDCLSLKPIIDNIIKMKDIAGLSDLLKIKYVNPDQVKDETNVIISKLSIESKKKLCEILLPLRKELAIFIGDLIDIATPDTDGVIGTSIQYKISNSNSNGAFEAAKSVTYIFKDPKIIEEKITEHKATINNLIIKIKNKIPLDSYFKKKYDEDIALPLLNKYNDYLNKFTSKIQIVIDIYKKSIPLLFIVTSINC